MTQVTSEIDRLDGSKFSSSWSFLPYYQVKECLAIIFEKANLLEHARNQYIDLEDAYKRHSLVEQKNGSKDRCFSAYFSSGSDSKLVIDNEYDTFIGRHFQETKKKLGNGRITKFDFHQYVVSKIIRLYFKQGMYEQGLIKATSFINESYKSMSMKKDVSPIFVQAWTYSASFSIANFCTEKLLKEIYQKKLPDRDAKTQLSLVELMENKDVLQCILEDPQKRMLFILISNLLFISKRQLKRLGYLRKLIPTHLFYEELCQVAKVVGIDIEGEYPESQLIDPFSDSDESVVDVQVCDVDTEDDNDVEITIIGISPKETPKSSEQASSEFYDENLVAVGSTSASPTILKSPKEPIDDVEPIINVSVDNNNNNNEDAIGEKQESEGSEASKDVNGSNDGKNDDNGDRGDDQVPKRGRISLDIPRDELSISISTEVPKSLAKSMYLKRPPMSVNGRPLSYMQSMEETQKVVYSPMASPHITCESSSPDITRKTVSDTPRSKKIGKRTDRGRGKSGCSSSSAIRKREPSAFVTSFYHDDFDKDLDKVGNFNGTIEDFERNVSDETLMNSLRSEEEFDNLFDQVTKKSEFAFNLAKRNRSTISLICELAFHNL